MKLLFKDTLIYGLSNVLSKALSLVTLPIYANLFSLSDYGVMSISITFCAFLTQLIILQLDSGVFRSIADDDSQLNKKITLATYFWFQILLSAILFSIIYLINEPLQQFLFSSKTYKTYLLISVLLVCTSASDNTVYSIWRIERKSINVSIYSLLSSILSVAFTYYFVAKLKLGLNGVVYGGLLLLLLKLPVVIFFIYDKISITNIRKSKLYEMLKYSIPLVPAGLSLWLVYMVDRIILEKFENVERVGIYSMANNYAALITIPLGAFITSWTPHFFSILKNNNHKIEIANAVKTFVLLGLAILVLLTMFSSEFLVLFTNKKFYESNNYIFILLFSNFLMSLYQLSGTGSAISKKTKNVFYSTVIAAILNIILNIVLVPLFSIYGACYATLISYAFIPIYLFYLSQKAYKIPYDFKIISLASLLAFTFLILCNNLFTNFNLSYTFLSIKIIVAILIVLFVFFKVKNIFKSI